MLFLGRQLAPQARRGAYLGELMTLAEQLGLNFRGARERRAHDRRRPSSARLAAEQGRDTALPDALAEATRRVADESSGRLSGAA